MILKQNRLDNQLVHVVDKGIDSGPILDNKLSLIPSEFILPFEIDNYRTQNFFKFYKNFLSELKNKKAFIKKEQPRYIGSYNARLNTSINGWIDWSYKSLDLLNFINAFGTPYKGASTMINKKRVFIKGVQLQGCDQVNHPFANGMIIRHDKEWIVISISDHHNLIIEKIIDEKGKNIIEKLKEGDRFFTPSKFLDAAKSERVFYSAKGKI